MSLLEMLIAAKTYIYKNADRWPDTGAWADLGKITTL